MKPDTPILPSGEAPSRPRALAALALAYLGYAAAVRRLPAVTACPFRRLTGRRCPLCGLTRGVNRMLAGDLRAARSLHPLSVPVAILLGAGSATLLRPSRVESSKEVPWP